MAKDDLTGNMPTEKMLDYFTQKGIVTNINQEAFAEAMAMASKVFA
jgi:hydroxymethylglutaryl-CoA lyase